MKDIIIFTKTDEEELLPIYSSELAAGADVRAAISEPINLEAGQSKLVPTGIFVEIPEGYELQLRPRSGLALHNQITILNTPGTIDADYRGEIGVILINHSKKTFVIEPKMRIAQLILAPICHAVYKRKEELVTTERGGGGFGHTGIL